MSSIQTLATTIQILTFPRHGFVLTLLFQKLNNDNKTKALTLPICILKPYSPSLSPNMWDPKRHQFEIIGECGARIIDL